MSKPIPDLLRFVPFGQVAVPQGMFRSHMGQRLEFTGYTVVVSQGLAPYSKQAARLLRVSVGAGIVLRLFHGLYGRSMWADEACLALNILHRSFRQLAGSLDFHQAAPLGFLWLEKVETLVLGTSDLSFRLPLVAAGIVSLFLFARVVWDVVPTSGALVSVGLFAFSWPLARYSSELKPYGMDVLAGVCVWWWFLWMKQGCRDRLCAVASGVAGGLLIWFSFPAALILASAGLVLMWREIRDRDRGRFTKLLCIGGIWFASGLIAYVTTIRPVSEDSYLIDFWRSTFMPWPPWSSQWLHWVPNTGAAILRNTLGLPLSPLAAVALVTGVVSLIRRRTDVAVFLLLPIGFSLVASALGRYPFTGRFLLFAAAAMFAFLGEGVAVAVQLVDSKPAVIAVWLLVLALVFQPVWLAAAHVVGPGSPQETKFLLHELSERVSPASTLILDGALLCPYRRYRERFHLTDLDYRVVRQTLEGRSTDEVIVESIGRNSRGKELWLLLSDLGRLDPSSVSQNLTSLNGVAFHRAGALRAKGVVLFWYRCSQDPE